MLHYTSIYCAVSAKITLDFFKQDNILITYDIKNQNIIDEINVPYISDANVNKKVNQSAQKNLNHSCS